MAKTTEKQTDRDVAANLPVIPGQTIQMPIAVAFEFMLLNDLEFDVITSLGYATVRPVGKDGNGMALKETLGNMLARSDRSRKPERQTLFKGLRVELWSYGEEDNRIALQISREKVYPAGKEWFAVLRHFPVVVTSSEQKRIEHKGRFYLKGMLRRVPHDEK
jgi:hypothetical protein